MSAPKVRGNYADLAKIAQGFQQSAEASQRMLHGLKQNAETLHGGDWVGHGAVAFQQEMTGQVLPAIQRLVTALQTAGRTALQISQIVKQAEEDAARLFQARAGGEGEKKSGGFWHQVGGFFEGLWEGGKGMVEGLWHAVTHPIDTLKGLAYGITHPGELWEALKKPYVEDWNSGNQGRAIGRGVFEVVMLLIPGIGEAKAVGKGAEVAATAARVAEVSEAARVVAAGGRLTEVASAADKVADIGRAAELTDAARIMKSSNELMGIERASPELIEAVSKRRIVKIAEEGSEEMRYLDYIGAEANVGGPNMDHILLRPNPSKAAVLEEFLHGTQQRLGIVDKLGHYGLGSAETHVKDFMIRHQRLLGLSDADVEVLKILRDRGL